MKYLFVVIMISTITACNSRSAGKKQPVLAGEAAFQKIIDGKSTSLYTIKNTGGMTAQFTNYGARLVNLLVPGKNESLVNVVVGFDSLSGYENSTEPYFGATIGRYGNRIAKGKFFLLGKEYHLSVNNGPNTLHGGKNGFQYKVWDVKQSGDSSIEFSYLSKDGEEGFPGDLTAKVRYTLTKDNELKMEYEAVTGSPAVVNLTNHAFFNLNGEGTILGHRLQINAGNYTPVDSTLIPTGAILSVQHTPFDFTTAKTMGININDKDQQLLYGKGYDHNFVLDGTGFKKAATVVGEKTGIMMDIFTTEPGLQFYSGNFMQGKNRLRTGMDDFRTAFCLETQHFPDSPNQSAFPSTMLLPGQQYHSLSTYKFSVAH